MKMKIHYISPDSGQWTGPLEITSPEVQRLPGDTQATDGNSNPVSLDSLRAMHPATLAAAAAKAVQPAAQPAYRPFLLALYFYTLPLSCLLAFFSPSLTHAAVLVAFGALVSAATLVTSLPNKY